jgi:hypothetical protein
VNGTTKSAIRTISSWFQREFAAKQGTTSLGKALTVNDLRKASRQSSHSINQLSKKRFDLSETLLCVLDVVNFCDTK